MRHKSFKTTGFFNFTTEKNNKDFKMIFNCKQNEDNYVTIQEYYHTITKFVIGTKNKNLLSQKFIANSFFFFTFKFLSQFSLPLKKFGQASSKQEFREILDSEKSNSFGFEALVFELLQIDLH